MKGGTGPNADAARKLTHRQPRPWTRRKQSRRVGADRPEAPRRHDAACRLAPSRAGHLQVDDLLARERARPDGDAVHAAARAAPAESYRVRERHPRPARPRDRSRRSICRPTTRRAGSTISPAHWASRRRWSKRTSRPRGRSAGWQSAKPATPNLVVYRTPEDTSQDYHIEGLPFGTRGGMLVTHVFPSDGEYTVTVTPIFGDNMSPTGFRIGPVRKARSAARRRAGRAARLAGRRTVAWRGHCGGADAAASADAGRLRAPDAARGSAGRHLQQPPRQRAVAAPGLAPVRRLAAAAGGGGRRPRRPQMRVRIKTTAGPHAIGVTFLQPISRRCSISISISCATPCRLGRRRDSPSSRTSARCGSRARTTPRPQKTPRAGAGFSCAVRLGRR